MVLRLIERVKQARTAERRLLHDRRITKFLDKSVLALDGRIRDFGCLGGSVSLPCLLLKTIDKRKHAVRVGEVYKRVADVVRTREVDAQIDEVVLAEAILVKNLLQCQLSNH